MKADGDPNLICYFGGGYMPLGEARVGILTHALHYGTGVFEGIRGYWDEAQEELFLLRAREHFERWKKNCGILRIHLPLSTDELVQISVELVRRNNFRTNIYIRPLAYKSAERVGVAFDDQDAFAIVALPFGDYLPSANGLHAGVTSWRRVEDNAIPARAKICGAYVNSALASDEVRRSGFDEAIFLNEGGHVAEGSTCNIFMVRDGVLLTPPVSENVLEGITRDCVIRLAHNELCMEVAQRPIDRSELYVCDELFFTGTAVGLAPITRVDHHPVGDGNLGAVARRIQKLYFDATRGYMPNYRNWLVPVYRSRLDSAEDLHSLVGNNAG
ncbi:MAG: branched-chain amino acid transaminase [Terracidiphilus sp.]